MEPNQLFANLSTEIINAVDPLAALGVTKFTYFRRYADGSEAQISNTPEWIDFFYRNKLHTLSDYWHIPSPSLSYQVWPPSDAYPIFQNSWHHFQHGVGLLVTRSLDTHTEFYFFKASEMNLSVVNKFLNYFDVFERFILYFNEQYRGLIEQVHRHRVRLVSACPTEKFTTSTDKDAILSSLKTGYTLQQDAIPITLSPRELDCALAVMNKCTAKDISDQLCLSERTIEIHLKNLKEKLNCDSKKSLIDRLHASELASLISR